MKEKKIRFKQSKNWHWFTDKSLEWMIQNANHVYIAKRGNGIKPIIVTKIKIEGCDSFQLSNDRHGITLSSAAEHTSPFVVESWCRGETEIRKFIATQMKIMGCEEFVNPNWFRRTRRRFKRFLNRFSCK